MADDNAPVWQQNRTTSSLWSRLDAALLVHDVPIAARLATANVRSIVDRLQATVREGAVPATPQLPATKCVVCWEGYNDNDKFPAVFGCGHMMCFECVKDLPTFKCPTCRAVIDRVVRLYT